MPSIIWRISGSAIIRSRISGSFIMPWCMVIIRSCIARRRSGSMAAIRSIIPACICCMWAWRSSGDMAAIRSRMAAMSISPPIISCIMACMSGLAIMRWCISGSAIMRSCMAIICGIMPSMSMSDWSMPSI